MNVMEAAMVVVAWVPIFMLGLLVGKSTSYKPVEIVKDMPLVKADPKDMLGLPKLVERTPISIKPAFSTMEWHPADEDGDTLDEFPKSERTASFADVPSPIGVEESGVVPSPRRFKSTEMRRYSSGEVKAVPEIKKREPTTPVIGWKAGSYSKIDRT